MKKRKKKIKAFTLIELLAVIVILAIVLVIAVPQIMETIEKSKKGGIEASARLVANSVETKYQTSQAVGDTISLTGDCMDIGNLDTDEYKSCTYTIDSDGLATITLKGKSGGKFEGYTCTDATKNEATCTKSLIPDPVSFETDSWATIQKAVQENNTSVYNVGDTKTIDLGDLGEHTVRIANKSTPAECLTEGFSQTACGFVVEFVDIITKKWMNNTSTNTGGWEDSEIRKYIQETIQPAIIAETGDILANTYVVSGHGSPDSSNFTTIDKVYLLAQREIMLDGTTIKISSKDSAYDNSRQLDYYSDPNGDGDYSDAVTTSNNYSAAIKIYNSYNLAYWTRTAEKKDNKFFLGINTDGNWSTINAYTTSTCRYGISPAFRIA